MSGGIYTIRFAGRPHFYVGKTWSFKKREQHHLWCLRAGRHHNARLQAIFNTVGESALRFVREEIVADRVGRTFLEQEWLNRHFGSPECVNFDRLSVREHVGPKRTKRVAWNKGVPSARKGVARTPEEREAIRAATRGKPKRPRSTPISEAERARRSQSLSGRTLSDATRARISQVQTGKRRGPRPEWVREKIRAGKMGKPLSDAHREALREARRRRRECVEAAA